MWTFKKIKYVNSFAFVYIWILATMHCSSAFWCCYVMNWWKNKQTVLDYYCFNIIILHEPMRSCMKVFCGVTHLLTQNFFPHQIAISIPIWLGSLNAFSCWYQHDFTYFWTLVLFSLFIEFYHFICDNDTKCEHE